MSCERQLAAGLAELGLVLPEASSGKLLAYLDLLFKWNRTYNLTALSDPESALGLHLLDSLAVLPYLPADCLLDVGSGGGLPGIPLAIARPELAVTLLDSNSKKTAFLRQAAIDLELPNVDVHCGRVEQYHPQTGYPAIISRAFSDLAKFVELTRHLLADGGCWLAMKGIRPQDEIVALPADVRIAATHRLQVPAVDGERHLIVIHPDGNPGSNDAAEKREKRVG